MAAINILIFGLISSTMTAAYDIHYTSNDINSIPQSGPSPVRIASSFSWSNCGASGIPASFSNLSILPDPIVIPGHLTLDLKGQTSVDAISPVPAQITLKRKVLFFWVTVPCIENVGTCNYNDFCTLLDTFFPPSQGCPPLFTQHNIPCHCPIATGTYVLPASDIDVPTDPLPSALTDGQYDLKLKVQTTNGAQLICLDVKFTLGSQ